MMETNPQASASMSTKELAIKALDFDFKPSIPLKFWIRTSDSLLREVKIAIFLFGHFYLTDTTGLYL